MEADLSHRLINSLEGARTVHSVSWAAAKVEATGVAFTCLIGLDVVALPLLLLFLGSAGVNVATTPGLFHSSEPSIEN
jgi:hypothetical protein